MSRSQTSSRSYTRWTSVEPFSAIGLRVADQAAYESLAEQARQCGAPSQARREEGVMHGRCWSLGDGLEVWTVLYESGHGLFYADCRPAFRGRQLFSFYPWEIIEFEEGGEAWARGLMRDTSLTMAFELQNITEIDPRHFCERPLVAAVSGLAYRAQINKHGGRPVFEPLKQRYPRRDVAENDYVVRGRVVSWREITNPLTTCDVVWVNVAAGAVNIEVLINRAELKGSLQQGAWLSAEVWLQGHVLKEQEVRARYEGLDTAIATGQLWKSLRRRY
jgi:hypothetical protein